MTSNENALSPAAIPRSVPELLRHWADRAPDREALAEVGGPRLTYRQLWEQASQVAGGLIDEGVAAGDRVAITYPNGAHWCVAFLGVLIAGASAVPVNTRLASPERDFLLRDAGTSVELGPGRMLPSGSAPSTVISADAVAEVFYTSGTSGSPKGVVITHRALLTAARNVVTVLELPDTGVRSLIAVPLFHVMATNNQLLPSLYVGGTAVVLPSFDPSRFALALAREQIQAVTAVPAIYWALLNDGIIDHVDTSQVRWVCYGAAATHGEQLARLAAAFPQAALSTGYGMTETTGGVTNLPHELALSAPTSIGRPMPGVELALADVDPVTGTGELLVRSAQVMAGYWQLPAATAAVLRDGWLHTGDVARVDDNGLYYIVDRLRDIINRGGEKVFCPEVEGVLAGHPDVDEVAVLGVPDAMMGQKVGAVVVPAAGRRPDGQQLAEHVARSLADYKVPQFIWISDQPLPRNAAGKVLKPDLASRARWRDVPRPMRHVESSTI
jgi:long-chain acyl-CoA synthetase